jgi:hypothetical protein
MKPPMTLRRLESFFLICFERVARIVLLEFGDHGLHVGLRRSTSRTASAPILATKASSPYSSTACGYSVSVRSCLISSGVLPGSITM